MAKPLRENGEYVRLNEIGKMLGERCDCSVIAFAAALDVTYKIAHGYFEKAGRKKGGGATTPQIMNALMFSKRTFRSHRGRNVIRESGYKYSKTLTFNNCVKVLDKKKVYIVIGTQHMAALKYGQVIDWAEGRKMKVNDVIEMT